MAGPCDPWALHWSPGSCFSPQDDLHIVDSLELPTADPQYLTELAQYRHWGSSVLLVDL